MRSLVLLVVAALAAANPVTRARVKSRQAPSSITITNFNTSGSGCPTGTVSESVSTDGTVVTFGFSSFQTYIGPGWTMADSSKNCQLHLSLKYPPGFTYAVVDAVYHGYAQLDKGVTGTFLSSYFFSQAPTKEASTRSTISGPLDGIIYTKEDQIPTATTIWAPCGDTGILNINNRISLVATDSTQSGSVTDDDATVGFTQEIHVIWQRCPTSGSSSSGGSFTTGPGATALIAREADNTGPDYSSPTSVFWVGPGTTTVTEGGTTEYYGPPDEYRPPGGTTTIVTSGKQ